MRISDEYVAGLFDADGYVGIVRSKIGTRILRCSIANCYRPVLVEIKARFGGGVFNSRKETDEHRPHYCWAVTSEAAGKFLEEIAPYTIVKAEQIALAIEFQESVRRHRFALGNQYYKADNRDEVMARRDQIAEEIRLLKHQRYYP